ncbi:MAG: glycoside hydrolase family protein [Parcubacteria group bacterium Gr01-1014_44]|nr:MAG: glycoside hydrolase family protein [Parcubacteria group bacterium Gr01-1014_44]
MKIVLATGIFYPDVGGPAIHVRKIAEALVEKGHRPVVLAYGDYDGPDTFNFEVKRVSRKLPSWRRWLKYLWLVLTSSFGAEAIYAFNLSTAGIPVFLTGKLLCKKILIRVPGDPIWERVVEGGKRFVTIQEYYERGLYMKDRPWVFRAIKFALSRFDKIVFYSPLLRDLYEKYYGVSHDKTKIILNPVSKRLASPTGGPALNVLPASETTILFAGRFVAYKNLELVIKVFDKVRQKLGQGQLILIGDGPDKEKLAAIIKTLPSSGNILMIPKINQEKLFEYIRSATFGIGPALTEFNPNFILECLSFGQPVLLSRGNGLTVQLPEEFLFDSKSAEELEFKMSQFFDEEFYRRARAIVAGLDLYQTWESVTKAHLDLLAQMGQN